MPTIMLDHVTYAHAQRMPCHVPSAKLLTKRLVLRHRRQAQAFWTF